MAESVVETRNLTRYFGPKCVVRALDLTVPRGCVFGFLGRNGAGKTTTIRMLLGLLEPTRGSATVLGHDSRNLPPEVRARIGYLAEGHQVYAWMRVAECGEFQRRFYESRRSRSGSRGHWNADLFHGVLKYFRLAPRDRVKNLSRGERAGLCLALTLAPEPELLVLDDPGLGLDPVARRALLESMVYVTRQADRTIFFSSHLIGDVERVADRIAVLDRGQLRACCALDEFRRRVRRVVLRFAGRPPELPAIPGLLHSLRTAGELALTVANYDGQTEGLINTLGAERVEEVPIDLEEAFVSYLAERGERSFFLGAGGGA